MCQGEAGRIEGEMGIFKQCSGAEDSDGLGETGRARIGGLGSDIFSMGPLLASLPTGGPMGDTLASPMAKRCCC